MSIKTYQISIKGKVTGVGFRYATLREVNKYLNIFGYVRNVCSNEVEVVVQGEEYDVKCILTWLHHGPSYSRVDDIKFNEIPTSKNLPPFKITY